MVSKIIVDLIALNGNFKDGDQLYSIKSAEDMMGKSIIGKTIVGIIDTKPNQTAIDQYIEAYKKDVVSLETQRLAGTISSEIEESIHCALFVNADTYKYALENSITISYIGYTYFDRTLTYSNVEDSFLSENDAVISKMNDEQNPKIIMPFEELRSCGLDYLNYGGLSDDAVEYDLFTLSGWESCLEENEVYINIKYVDIETGATKAFKAQIVGVHNQDDNVIIGNAKVSSILSLNKYEIRGLQVKLSDNYAENEEIINWMLTGYTVGEDIYSYIPQCGYWDQVERMMRAKNIGWMPFFITIGVVLGLIAMLMIWNFTYTTIIDNRKNLGILMSLGACKFDVSMIYIIESIIIWIVSNALSYTLIPLYRFIFGDINKAIKAFNYKIEDILIVTAFSLVVIVAGSLFSIIKLIKKKPIDIMRN